MIQGSVTGVNELLAAFKRLPASTQNKAMRPALRKGGTVIAKAARENVIGITGQSPESTGLLARNIRVYSFRKYMGMLRMGVMIRKGAVNLSKRDKDGPVRIGLYGSVLEYRPGKSWLRKAGREKSNEALDALLKEAQIRMDDAIRDAAK